MNPTITHDNSTTDLAALVRMEGPLTSASGPELEDYITRLLPQNRSIILDGSGTDFLSSAGLGLLLILNRRIAASGGSFILAGFSEENSMLLQILGFDRIIQSAATLEAAVEKLKKNASSPARPVPPISSAPSEGEPPLEKKPQTSFEPAAEETNPGPPAPETFIIECSFCKSLVRVRGEGDYICPECSRIFKVGAQA